ncbi:dihydrolipoamide acetyltransferase family protein [Aureimonas populi]|uniref:Dihydrolipoamide acetyltransferase component of pyruvate dehydrogenase complex n=1 Tax=Aureimonas populi TaxID=1701758 RepID=A0ABW5CH95_9HYPH|nr:2-oxo acid dehydrogenase subunit E2 [Aureimonas populi]
MSARETDAAIDVTAPVEQEGTKAVVRAWLKTVGEHVAEGEALVELETDKVAVEVPSPASGMLVEIVLVTDEAAAPGAVLGRISPGESGSVEALPPESAPDRPAPPAAGCASISDFDPALRLSPSVRKLLMETGLDPAGLDGTGKDGRLTRADVAAAAGAPAPEVAKPAPGPAARPAPGPAGRRVPHSPMRRRIAEHMAHSVAVAPHVTAVFEADLSAILAHRARHKAALAQKGVGLTPTAYFIAASVEAMKAAPAINSRWHEDALELFDDCNIGIGTALAGGEGLIVPVVERAQTLSLEGIAARLTELTGKARAGRLAREDVRNGTFTISNHGVSGSILASPIVINQPQSAILGVGKMEKRAVVRQVEGTDALLIRPMAYVTLTIDHRVVDGAEANAWLTRFVEVLEGWREG